MALRPYVLFALLFAGPAGCGGGSQALDRRVRDLQQQLTQMQNENDRLAERVTSLELERAAAAAAPAETGANEENAVFDRPPLKVVRMAPGQTPEAQAPAAPETEPSSTPPPAESPSDSKRPVLRMRGSKGGIRQGSGQPSRS